MSTGEDRKTGRLDAYGNTEIQSESGARRAQRTKTKGAGFGSFKGSSLILQFRVYFGSNEFLDLQQFLSRCDHSDSVQGRRRLVR